MDVARHFHISPDRNALKRIYMATMLGAKPNAVWRQRRRLPQDGRLSEARCRIENVSAALLPGEAPSRLSEPLLGMMPRIQKTEFREVNDNCVLGDGARNVTPENKSQHPNRSTAWLKDKPGQRYFENSRELLDMGLNIHPRSLLAHYINLRFQILPELHPQQMYRKLALCKASKSLHLFMYFDFIGQKIRIKIHRFPASASTPNSKKVCECQ